MRSFLSQGFSIVWRGLVVGMAYMLGLMASGLLLGMLGLIKTGAASNTSTTLPWLFVAAVLIGLVMGPIAAQIKVSRAFHCLIWTSLIFFNLASVMLEGAYFAPERVPLSLPVLAFQQFLAALLTGLTITLLFAPTQKPAPRNPEKLRFAWYAWAWRFIASALVYLLLYWVFGGINYALVTQPYYATHAGGLTVPPAQTVLIIELVRAPLIILSILPLLLALRTNQKRTLLLTGMVLFVIGGIVPLLFQVTSLPLLLLAASAVEIFLQNFFTGAISAYLLSPGTRQTA